MRTEFLSMVSHELRAPLSSIKGSAATVLGASPTLDPAEMLQFFRVIDDQADHMRGLIRDLLDVGRIEAGTLSVAPEPTDVTALVDQARIMFTSGGGRHAVRIDLPPELPRVMADRQRIVQVLNNLLSNAARHSPESSPIRISATVDGVHVAISVSDEGRGVPLEQLPHLFRKHAGLAGASASASASYWTPSSASPGAAGPRLLLRCCRSSSCRRSAPGSRPGSSRPTACRRFRTGAHRPVLRPPRDGVPDWTLASNARWRLTDEQLALLWQAEFPNSRTRYTVEERPHRAQPLQPGQAQQRPAPDAAPAVRSRWESGAGHAVLLTPWPATPHRNDRPVGSDTIHASIAHGIEYDDAVLPASAPKNRGFTANAGSPAPNSMPASLTKLSR